VRFGSNSAPVAGVCACEWRVTAGVEGGRGGEAIHLTGYAGCRVITTTFSAWRHAQSQKLRFDNTQWLPPSASPFVAKPAESQCRSGPRPFAAKGDGGTKITSCRDTETADMIRHRQSRSTVQRMLTPRNARIMPSPARSVIYHLFGAYTGH